MMLYDVIKPLLFQCDAEASHDGIICALSYMQKVPGLCRRPPEIGESVQYFGLSFPNRVGLAAGMDKNARCIPAWQSFGFGFIEVGTVTPRAQEGNPKPRLFRLTKERAIINRLGFNNRGIDFLVSQLQSIKRDCPIGINIGKNRETPLDRAREDYQYCFQKAYPWADYITINLSSPNTPGLRTLQEGDYLKGIIGSLMETRQYLADREGKQVPIIVKISPDLTPEALARLVEDLLALQVDGVIATNTTISGARKETGGLSGAPLKALATQTVRLIYQQAGEALPIIAVGGILSAEDAQEKRDAGAVLVQIYTGFVYQGPRLIQEIKQRIQT